VSGFRFDLLHNTALILAAVAACPVLLRPYSRCVSEVGRAGPFVKAPKKETFLISP
jgi:hypothetical protein